MVMTGRVVAVVARAAAPIEPSPAPLPAPGCPPSDCGCTTCPCCASVPVPVTCGVCHRVIAHLALRAGGVVEIKCKSCGHKTRYQSR